MKYILDTDSISFLYDQESAHYLPVFQRVSNCRDSDRLCVSVLSLFELEYSFYNAPESKKENLRFVIQSIKEDFEILPLDESLSSKYGQLKSLLKKTKHIQPRNMKKHNIDLMIAATAVSEDSALVSADNIYRFLAEFCPDLKIEDWTGI